jgi:hypothetical protein
VLICVDFRKRRRRENGAKSKSPVTRSSRSRSPRKLVGQNAGDLQWTQCMLQCRCQHVLRHDSWGREKENGEGKRGAQLVYFGSDEAIQKEEMDMPDSCDSSFCFVSSGSFWPFGKSKRPPLIRWEAESLVPTGKGSRFQGQVERAGWCTDQPPPLTLRTGTSDELVRVGDFLPPPKNNQRRNKT